MPRELTPEEMETVEERLADLFAHECDNIAKELGITPIPGRGAYRDADAALINAEFDRQYKQGFIDDFSRVPLDEP